MSSCCPPNIICFPVPPIPPPVINPAPLNGPIRGITNGNAADPGNVGEFIQRSVQGTLTVAATSFALTTVTPLTLGPGDWDLIASLTVSLLFNGAGFTLNPSIPGASSLMAASTNLPGAVQPQFTTAILNAPRTQLLTASAATILQFDIRVANTGGASQTGAYVFSVSARRMR